MKESNCKFDFIENIDIKIKFDDNQDYRLASGYGVKGVDFIVKVNDNVYFIEIKSYSRDYSDSKELKEKLRRDLLLKLINSIGFCVLNYSCANLKKSFLEKNQLVYIVYLCPPVREERKLTFDKIVSYKETIFNKLKKKIEKANLNIAMRFYYYPKTPLFFELIKSG